VALPADEAGAPTGVLVEGAGVVAAGGATVAQDASSNATPPSRADEVEVDMCTPVKIPNNAGCRCAAGATPGALSDANAVAGLSIDSRRGPANDIQIQCRRGSTPRPAAAGNCDQCAKAAVEIRSRKRQK